MKINLMYEIVGSYPYEIKLEDYFDEEVCENWDKLTKEEKDKLLFDLGEDLQIQAEREFNDYSLGVMEDWEES